MIWEKIIQKRNISVSAIGVISGWRDHRCFFFNIVYCIYVCRVGGIVVSVAAFQAVHPGSIPSQRSVSSVGD